MGKERGAETQQRSCSACSQEELLEHPQGVTKQPTSVPQLGPEEKLGCLGKGGKKCWASLKGVIFTTQRSHMRIKKHKFITHGNVLNFRNQSFFDYLENAYLKMHLHF